MGIYSRMVYSNFPMKLFLLESLHFEEGIVFIFRPKSKKDEINSESVSSTKIIFSFNFNRFLRI